MPSFSSYDGTELAYHVRGEGTVLVCLPGGPMRDSEYFGNLGGLDAHLQLVFLDLRGSGSSAVPEDLSSCRCDRLVADIEALRMHLGLDRIDLLAHSAGANLAVRYVEHYPGQVGKLALITPSVRAVGIEITNEERLEIARSRRTEQWFAEAMAALEGFLAGADNVDVEAAVPFHYGRWDETARAHQAGEDAARNAQISAQFSTEGAFDPQVTSAALASFAQPVFVLAGDMDMVSPPTAMAKYTQLFPKARLQIQPRAAHYPWLDDANRFVESTAGFFC